MTHNYEIANEIINLYCNDFGIDKSELFSKHNKKLSRVNKDGVNLAFIRQSLAHFLYKKVPLTVTEIGRMIGYSDHSTVCLNSRMVDNHIEIQDPYFMPYYNRLINIATPLVNQFNYERVNAHWLKYVDKKLDKFRTVQKNFV